MRHEDQSTHDAEHHIYRCNGWACNKIEGKPVEREYYQWYGPTEQPKAELEGVEK